MRAFASPLRRVELADRGSHIFSPPQCEAVHKCAKLFGARAEEDWRRRLKSHPILGTMKGFGKIALLFGLLGGLMSYFIIPLHFSRDATTQHGRPIIGSPTWCRYMGALWLKPP